MNKHNIFLTHLYRNTYYFSVVRALSRIRTILYAILLILSIPFSYYLILRSSTVQHYLLNNVTTYLSSQWHTKVQVRAIDFQFFSTLILKDIYIEDLNNDTLLYVKRLYGNLEGINWTNNSLFFSKIRLNEAKFQLNFDVKNNFNLDFIINYFSSDTTDTATTLNSWYYTFRKFEVQNSSFIYKDNFLYNSANKKDEFDYTNIRIDSIYLSANKIFINDSAFRFQVKDFKCKEQCGFNIRDFFSNCFISQNRIICNNLSFKSNESSIKVKQLVFNYNEFVNDFTDYLNSVTIQAKIDDTSVVSANDIGYFASLLKHNRQKVTITNAFVKGCVNNLKVINLNLFYADNSKIRGDFLMRGDTFFVDLKELTTSAGDLRQIQITPFSSNKYLEIPKLVNIFETLHYQCIAFGIWKNFNLHGTLNTILGTVKTDINLEQQPKNQLVFNGELETIDLDFGKISGQNKFLGKTTLLANIEGVTDADTNFTAKITANFKLIELFSYQYSNLLFDGIINNKSFEGSIALADPNIALKMNGLFDFNVPVPRIEFETEIKNAKLNELNIQKFDSLSNLSITLNSKFLGNNIDNITGFINFTNAEYENNRGNFNLKKCEINAHESKLQSNETERVINFESDFFDADIKGNFRFIELASVTQHAINQYFPSLLIRSAEIKNKLEKDLQINSKLTFGFYLKDSRKLSKLFFPSLTIAANTVFTGNFDAKSKHLYASGLSPQIKFGATNYKEMFVKIETVDTVLNFFVGCKALSINDIFAFRNLSFKNQIYSDSIKTNIIWDNKGIIENKADINIFSALHSDSLHNHLFTTKIQKSAFIVEDSVWSIESGLIKIDSTLNISNLQFFTNSKKIAIDGKWSKTQSDSLRILFNNFELADLNPLTEDYDLLFEGEINGKAVFNFVNNRALFHSNLKINNLSLNQVPLGKISLQSKWDEVGKKLIANLTCELRAVKTIDIHGSYTPKNEAFDFKVGLKDISVSLFQPYMTDILSDIRGDIFTDNLTLTGTVNEPLLNGKLLVSNASCVVDYLRTQYFTSPEVIITPTSFEAKNIEILDINKNKATANVSFTHQNFENLLMNLNFSANNLFILNTTEKDNSSFFGKAYGSGNVSITGDVNNIDIDVKVKTEKNTKFYIPLYTTSDIEEEIFIKFIKKDTIKIETEENEPYEISQSTGIQFTGEFEVTPDAEVQIVFDSKVGDVLKSRGSGNLKLDINTLGNFNMYGDYIIEKGDYLFTLKNIINKKFDINKGGTIKWNGDPYNADIDLDAMYSIKKASLYDLLLEETYKTTKIPVDCHLLLGDKLINPSVRFGLKIPNSNIDKRIETQLDNLSDDDLSIQTLSLLLLNRFQPLPGLRSTADARSTTYNVNANAGELLSNQLNVWLSQINSGFDIGVNYQVGDSLSNSELEVALSKQFLNNRVTINGNVGVSENQQNTTNIVGDVDVDVKMNKSGTIRLKAFNKANDNIITETSPYTQGFGFFYREDFNSFAEVRKKVWNKFRKIWKKEDEIQIPNY